MIWYEKNEKETDEEASAHLPCSLANKGFSGSMCQDKWQNGK